MKNTILLIFSLLILASCTKKNEECESIQPPEPAVNIRILNEAGKSLIGENNIYKPSEITLTSGDETIFLLFEESDEETYIKLYYPDIVSGQDYQLKLNEEETDVLNMKLIVNEGFCYDVLSVEAIFINGKKILYDTDLFSYIILK